MEKEKTQMIYFFLFNLLYMSIGVTMLGYGIFSVVDMQQYGSFSQNSFVAGAAIFIAVGALKMLFSVLGFVATFIHKKALFAVYVSFVVFLMFWTFIAAIYAFQSRVSTWNILDARLQSAYAAGQTLTPDLQAVQNNLNCCGRLNENDNAAMIPCNSNRSTDTLFGQGCLQHLGLSFTEQLYQVGAIGMGFAVFEGTALLVGMQHMQG